MSARTIRPAVEGDLQFVTELMHNALDQFYDGDHRAHAKRIFMIHIEGGHDRFGHFSEEQRMFILEEGGKPLGMLNIVGKRQGTWKISPLIVVPEAQNTKGCGSELLAFGEHYAQEHGARQMYCTVAEQNRSALTFFLKKGYIRAGRSESHYKPGVTEIMLYKLFFTTEELEQLDRDHISVVPYEEKYAEAVRQLILTQLPQYFMSVDERWVDALFKGYSRRSSGEVNDKYKLIFVAIDRSGTIVGAAGVTPKKGQPIKIMPCVASTTQALAALIADLPQHLKSYGRKLYVHLVPTVEQTIILQQMGWKIEAIMPGAYHNNHCAQQWGNNLEESYMRTMRVKGRFYREIMGRKKPLEVRVAYDNIRTIKPGEQIALFSGTEKGVIQVKAVRTYKNFTEMLDVEPAEHIVPDQNKVQVLALLRDIYPSHKEELGVVVFEIEPVGQR